MIGPCCEMERVVFCHIMGVRKSKNPKSPSAAHSSDKKLMSGGRNTKLVILPRLKTHRNEMTHEMNPNKLDAD